MLARRDGGAAGDARRLAATAKTAQEAGETMPARGLAASRVLAHDLDPGERDVVALLIDIPTSPLIGCCLGIGAGAVNVDRSRLMHKRLMHKTGAAITPDRAHKLLARPA